VRTAFSFLLCALAAALCALAGLPSWLGANVVLAARDDED
jgi:hypothetical protein